MIFESKCRRKIRLRIGGLIDWLGRPLTYDEIKTEFKKLGFPRPLKEVVETILREREKGDCVYYQLEPIPYNKNPKIELTRLQKTWKEYTETGSEDTLKRYKEAKLQNFRKKYRKTWKKHHAT